MIEKLLRKLLRKGLSITYASEKKDNESIGDAMNSIRGDFAKKVPRLQANTNYVG